jgi:hypothetical protein
MSKNLRGVPVNLDFAALVTSHAIPAQAQEPAPAVEGVQAQEPAPAIPANKGQESPPAPKKRAPRPSSSVEATKPRTLHLSDDVFDRLRLMAAQERCKISAIVERLLNNNADRFSVRKVG